MQAAATGQEFGKNPGSPPRHVRISKALHYCPNWLLGFFFPSPLIVILSLWRYLGFQSKLAMWTGVGTVAYLLIFFTVWLSRKFTLQNGEAVLGRITSVTPYNLTRGYVVFANYKIICYSYDQEGKTYSKKWIAEGAQIEQQKPIAGDGIWLIVDKNRKSKSFVWW